VRHFCRSSAHQPRNETAVNYLRTRSRYIRGNVAGVTPFLLGLRRIINRGPVRHRWGEAPRQGRQIRVRSAAGARLTAIRPSATRWRTAQRTCSLKDVSSIPLPNHLRFVRLPRSYMN
jgi:hypothetical protein